MRSVVFTCLISITFAAPNGYNYVGPNYNTGSYIQQHPHHQYAFNALSSPPVQQFLNNHVTNYNTGSTSYQPYNQQSYGGSGNNIGQHSFGHHYVQQQQQQPIVTKHIYIHSAPEERDEEIYQDNSIQQERKHFNIIFIKAPSQSIHKTAATLANVLNEQKTIIYVLSKKNDYSEIKQAIQNAPRQPQKPEVFFIKYKTPEEAQHAQNTIQAQYDALGGTTRISDEGFAPVSSVVGALGGGFNNGGFSGGGGFIGGNHGGPVISGEGISLINGNSFNGGIHSNAYLPPNKVVRN